MNAVHKQAYSHLIGAEVDEGLLELLELLHFHNVQTLYSCQGIEPCDEFPEGTDAYIAMMGDALNFVMRLAGDLGWDIARLPRSLTRRSYTRRVPGENNVFIESVKDNIIVIRFHRTQIGTVVERLNAIYDRGLCCALPANDVARVDESL